MNKNVRNTLNSNSLKSRSKVIPYYAADADADDDVCIRYHMAVDGRG